MDNIRAAILEVSAKVKAQEAAAAAAAEAKKAEPYERLWNQTNPEAASRDTTPETAAAQAAGTAPRGRSYTPPPTIENLDARTAWWKPPEPNGLINRNMRGY